MRAANDLAPPGLVHIGVDAAIGCYAWAAPLTTLEPCAVRSRALAG